MARRPISGIVRDGSGNIVASAAVAFTVYSNGAVVTCYATQTGGSALTNGATTSGTDGSYEIWIDSDDYAILTLFNITATKTGYTTKTTPIAA